MFELKMSNEAHQILDAVEAISKLVNAEDFIARGAVSNELVIISRAVEEMMNLSAEIVFRLRLQSPSVEPTLQNPSLSQELLDYSRLLGFSDCDILLDKGSLVSIRATYCGETHEYTPSDPSETGWIDQFSAASTWMDSIAFNVEDEVSANVLG